MKLIKVVDCTEHDEMYGILTVENASVKDVQNKICEIKSMFQDEGFEDWYIKDLFNRFPDEWEWHFESEVGKVEI